MASDLPTAAGTPACVSPFCFRFVVPCAKASPGAVEKRIADFAFGGSCDIFRGGTRGGRRVPGAVADRPLPRCRATALSLRLPRRHEGMLSFVPGAIGYSRTKRVYLISSACSRFRAGAIYVGSSSEPPFCFRFFLSSDVLWRRATSGCFLFVLCLRCC